MKKYIKTIFIFVVVISMFTSMCAGAYADISSLTPEEKEIIFYQVAVEKGIDLTALYLLMQNGSQPSEASVPSNNQGTLNIVNGGYDFLEADLPAGEDFIEVLDVELVEVDNGKYMPNIKLRNLFPEGAVEFYPDQLRVYVSYLDSDGFAVQSTWIELQHLGYGEGAWTEASGIYFEEEIFDASKIHTIAITGYRFMSVKGGFSVYLEDFIFAPAINYAVADLLPEGSSTDSESSSVTVEEAKMIATNNGVKVEAKVRNTSGIKRDVITVYYQLLDVQGDIIGNGSFYVQDLEAGQAAKGTSYTVSGCTYSEIGTIKFTSYSYGTFSGGTKTSWISKPGDGGDFIEPYIFDKNQLS